MSIHRCSMNAGLDKVMNLISTYREIAIWPDPLHLLFPCLLNVSICLLFASRVPHDAFSSLCRRRGCVPKKRRGCCCRQKKGRLKNDVPGHDDFRNHFSKCLPLPRGVRWVDGWVGGWRGRYRRTRGVWGEWVVNPRSEGWQDGGAQ